MENTKLLYKKLVKENGSVPFTHKELKEQLNSQDNKCEVCSSAFNPFTGSPVVIGHAETIVCQTCFEGINIMGFNAGFMSKAVVILNRLARSR